MKLNENQKITLTIGQLKSLIKESTIDSPDFSEIEDYETKLYAKLGWSYFHGSSQDCDEVKAKLSELHNEREWTNRANEFVNAVNTEMNGYFLEDAWVSNPRTFGTSDVKRHNLLRMVLKDENDAEEIKDTVSKIATKYEFIMVDSKLWSVEGDMQLDVEFRRNL